MVVPLADPARPVTMKISVLHGSITVRGYNGREVLVDTKGGGEPRREAPHEGLHRIDAGSSDLTIESENNVVSISQRSFQSGDITVQTPVNTTVKVKTMNGGSITIEGIAGDTEAQNLNGAVTVRNASGSVVASTLNGAVTVVLAKAAAGKPMSFSSLNGNVDVTLPPDIHADFALKTLRGEIYSDFDVKLGPSAKPAGEGKVQSRRSGAVNGGGPEFQFRTLNGNIYIRKGK
jgi:DUF4097 and DUF4098 domain-containing protein YvlB